MNRLEGKVAVITGCSHGMGLRAAQLFADEGAKVLATSWNMENLEKNLAGYSENIVLFQLDVREEDQWASAAAKAEELWGKIDILVNNAGLSAKCDLLKETLEGWEAGLRMNLTSQFLGIKTVIPYMQKNGKGSIINCSSDGPQGLHGCWRTCILLWQKPVCVLLPDMLPITLPKIISVAISYIPAPYIPTR